MRLICRPRERAAYKKQLPALSSKPGSCGQPFEAKAHFGRTFGLPPGLPGGGMTGVLPASGAGARICGSMSEGGHNTPSDFASWSERGSLACPVVLPSGAMVPRRGAGFVGVQSPATAVGESGVTAVGGACAAALATENTDAQIRKSACLIIERKRT